MKNRYIPAGPTARDEIANFAFWAGLMQGRPKEYDNLPEQMEFEEAKSNFVRAARYGNETCLNWMGKSIPASELIIKELLPLAAAGLQKMGLTQESIDKYLGIIRDRCQKQTGSQWMIKNFKTSQNEAQNR